MKLNILKISKSLVLRKVYPSIPLLSPLSTKVDNGKVRVTKKGMIDGKFHLYKPIFKVGTPEYSGEQIETFIDGIIDTHNSFIKNLGIKFGTEHYKKICLYCILLCEKRESIESPSRVSIGKTDKWPNCFGYLRPIYRVVINDTIDADRRAANLQLLHTLFKLNKVCEGFSELDIENIKSTFELPRELELEFTEYLKKELGDNSANNLKKLKASPSFGSSNGPNGVPKMQSASMEAHEMINSSLFEPFKAYCELTGNQPLIDYMETQSESYIDKGTKDKCVLRKLSAIPDAGNKSRVIAICDFWTQSLLSQLEKVEETHMNQKFGEFSSYYSHSLGFNKVKEVCNTDWRSIDASSWTDNFPSRLQYLYLKVRYGKPLAYAWRCLAADCLWQIGTSSLTVKYGKGQGMGTRGSFIIASVTDHYWLQFMSMKHYKRIVPYQKVGDDLVIEDKDNVFTSFYNSIGVPVNTSKSKMLTPGGHYVEYVSRQLWNRRDVSPISPKLVNKTRRQPFLTYMLLNHISERMEVDRKVFLASLVQNMELKEAEKNKLFYLIDVFNRFSNQGEEDHTYSLNPPSEEQFARIVLEALIVSNNRIRLKDGHVAERLSEEDNDKYSNLLNIQLAGDLGDFSLASQQRLDLTELKTFLFYKRMFTESHEVYSASLGEILPKMPPFWIQSTETGFREVNREVINFAFDLLLVTDKKICEQKIIHSLHNSVRENNKINILLFKSLNKIVKRSTEDLKIPATFNLPPVRLLFDSYGSRDP